MVVIIGFGIFLLSISNAFAAYQTSQNMLRMHQENVEITQAIRVYDKLTYNDQEGVFLGDKILAIANETIEEDFNPISLGYHYQIIINDVSDYQDSTIYKKTVQTSPPPSRSSKFTINSPVVIRVGEKGHAAQLIVTIWE